MRHEIKGVMIRKRTEEREKRAKIGGWGREMGKKKFGGKD